MKEVYIDNTSYKILKKIYDAPYITYADIKEMSLSPDIEAIVQNLESNKYISLREAASAAEDQGYETYWLEPHSHLLTLPKGNVFIENCSKEQRRWIIGTCIAVIGAIAAIMQLR